MSEPAKWLWLVVIFFVVYCGLMVAAGALEVR